MNTSFSH